MVLNSSRPFADHLTFNKRDDRSFQAIRMDRNQATACNFLLSKRASRTLRHVSSISRNCSSPALVCFTSADLGRGWQFISWSGWNGAWDVGEEPSGKLLFVPRDHHHHRSCIAEKRTHMSIPLNTYTACSVFSSWIRYYYT